MTRISKADIIEAVLFAADKPVPLKKLAEIAEVELNVAQQEVDILREEKARIGALQIVEVSGGWQIVTKSQFSSYIRQLREVPKQRMSRAAFEVLAIVAYRQPVTRADIEGLRSVDCSGPLQFLLERKLVAFAGRKEAPGRPWLYETTPQFLEAFGLRSLEDLPSLAEWAQLNAEAQAQSLFKRGTMQTTAEPAEEPSLPEENPVSEATAEVVVEGAIEPDETGPNDDVVNQSAESETSLSAEIALVEIDTSIEAEDAPIEDDSAHNEQPVVALSDDLSSADLSSTESELTENGSGEGDLVEDKSVEVEPVEGEAVEGELVTAETGSVVGEEA